jgi:lysyl-tRNA synthetase, class II
MLDDIIRERHKKLEMLRNAGVDPYPARAKRSHATQDVIAKFDELTAAGEKISVAGRLFGVRDQGKIIFADIEDETGKIQIVLKDEVTKDFDLWQATLDIGDFVGATGPVFVTKKGEKSVEAHELQMLAKGLLPLPSQHSGLEDEELRLRERYLDLIMNPDVREMFKKKSVFWQSTREFMQHEGFMEVETSVLESLAGGAEAEPFKTHHKALNTDFHLRISLELQLKRLIVGGFDKIFEIGRVFRNEGIDRDHLQDFTFMESYWAYHDYRDMMALMEKLFKVVIQKTCGTLTTKWQGHAIDWSGKWPEVDYVSAFKKENGFDPTRATRDELIAKAKELDLKLELRIERGRLIDLIYKRTVRPKLIQPCFLTGTPTVVSPLSKASRDNPAIAERFQIVACGSELCNGYSELNDPVDQRARFEAQMKLREGGDTEAMPLDEDFLNALSYGMPPTAGQGMSERVFAILMDKPIRETVFFPLMRPKQ